MKTWYGLLLISLTVMAGCAQGYSAKRPAAAVEPPAPQWTGATFQNPETDAERNARIWREESSR